ncbi:MAG: hypothetical protein OJF50_006007 [Nitrospira sp.]|nr:hypothetical protein [Nitrospira sp.]
MLEQPECRRRKVGEVEKIMRKVQEFGRGTSLWKDAGK